ncbi:MAG TPA: Ig-like domain-containing protein [Xanthomonadales bacterium]|nr:Ig-like domain-containing protein [Xanthomonadales bacterium]
MKTSTLQARALALATIVALSALAAPVANAAGCDATGLTCINELLIEMPGKDSSREYVELRGPAAGVIPAGTYLVSIDGDRQDNPGRIDTVVNLSGLSFGTSDGVSPYGFLVLLPQGSAYAVRPTANVVQSTATGFSGLPGSRWSGFNGAVNYVKPTTSYFLVSASTAPTVGVDIDSDNDGVPNAGQDPETLFTVWDSVGGSDMNNDRTYARINVRRVGLSSIGTTVSTTAKPGYFGRVGDSFGSGAGAWTLSGTPTGSYPNWLLGTSIPLGFAGKPLNHIGAINTWANVAPVNTLPVAPVALEDTPRLLAGASHISIADSDAGLNNETVTLAVANGIVTYGSTTGLVVTGNGSASVVATGTVPALNAALDTLSFLAPPDFNGPGATITVTTDDLGNTGTDGPRTDTDVLAIAVTPVNDAPSFTVNTVPTVLEGAPPQTFPGIVTAVSPGPADEALQQVAFAVTGNTNAALFSAGPAVAPDGTLTFTPTPGLGGSATITLTGTDDGGTANGGIDSATRTFDIVVQGINDAPTFTAGASQEVLEDAGAQVVLGWATNIDDGDNGVTQVVSFSVTANSAPALFSVAPSVTSAGTLTYTPAPDANGIALISVAASDDGGTSNGGSDTSPPQDFTITIGAVNDAPVFTAGSDRSAAANSGAQTADPWASGISSGPSDEAAQALSFQVVGNDNPSIFSVAPQVSASGVLTWTPAAATTGTANVQLRLVDDGGTANGGADTSVTRTFAIATTADVTPPALGASIEDNDADDFVLVNETLTYNVTFSEAMDASTIANADFANAGTATVTIANATASGTGATVEVTPTSLGTIVLRISGNVADPSGNLLVVPVDDDTTVRARTNTTTFITSDTQDPSIPGESYLVSVSVTAPFGGPTGTVQVVDDQGVTCSTPLTAGAGSCSLTSALGARTLTATYTPDDVSYIGSSDIETHDVFRPADLVTTNNDGDDYVLNGDPLLYTIVVSNTGPESLAGVRVQDLIPPELANAIWACTAGSCPSPSTGTGDIDVIVNLPIGSSVTFSLSANVAAAAPAGFVTNQASATVPSGYRDNTPANNASVDRDELYGVFKNGFE